MGIIQDVVDGFIMTVGITPPTPEKKRSATIFSDGSQRTSSMAICSSRCFTSEYVLSGRAG